MRIKNCLSMLAIGLTAVSCMDHHTEDSLIKDKIVTDYEAVKPFSTIYVPMEGHEGQVASVIVDGDTVATTNESQYVVIPNLAAKSRAVSPEVNVVYNDATGGVGLPSIGATMYYVLMFEDTKGWYNSKTGKVEGTDNDYNDVVLHIKQVQSQNSLNIFIQPVAMGNTKVMKIGLDMYIMDKQNPTTVLKSGRFYMSDNIKKDYFKESNELTMINTSQPAAGTGLKYYSLLTNTSVAHGYDFAAPDVNITSFNSQFIGTLKTNPIYVNWFIEDENGVRLYSVPAWNNGTATWEQTNGYPSGLTIAHIRTAEQLPASATNGGGWDWIDYPEECEDIETVYPGFTNWLKGTGNAPDWLNPQGKYIDAIGNYGFKSLFML